MKTELEVMLLEACEAAFEVLECNCSMAGCDGSCTKGIVDTAILKGQIMAKDYDKLDDDKLLNCGNCGHGEEAHYSETGHNCWEGSGHGNTCPCLEYRPGGE